MKQQEFFADVQYNRAKRNRFFVFLILGVLFIGGSGGSLVYLGGTSAILGYVFLAITLLLFVLIPFTLKAYPVHAKPIVVIKDESLVVNSTEVEFKAIKKVFANVTLNPEGKLDSDHIELLENAIKNPPTEEEIFRGTFDVVYLAEDGKIRTLYTTIVDCIGALQSLVNRGYNDYELSFTVKRFTKNAEYTLTPIAEQEGTLEEISLEERKKQLL